MLSREDVSSCFLEKNIFKEGAKQGVRFLLGLYKDGDCFFLFFLSRWKGSERSRGNLRWFPLDPLSTFDGDAVPLDSPCSIR